MPTWGEKTNHVHLVSATAQYPIATAGEWGTQTLASAATLQEGIRTLPRDAL